MAEDKGKKEEGEEGKAAEAAVAAPSSGGKKKLILILAAVFGLILVVGVPVTVYVMKAKSSEELNELSEDAAHGSKLTPAEGLEPEELLEGEEPLGAFYPLDTFVVNLKGGRYLRAQVQLEFAEREVSQRFYSRIVIMRDALIALLSSKSYEDLESESERDGLKTEIKDVVNEVLKKEEVKKVYFTQFVVQ